MKKGNILKNIMLLLFIFSSAILIYLLLHNVKPLTYDISSTKNNICQIHNLNMAKESIRIYYGLVQLDDMGREYRSLRSEYFPNSNDAINSGCVYSDIRYSVEYICDECNKEREKYKNLLEIKYTP